MKDSFLLLFQLENTATWLHFNYSHCADNTWIDP